MHIALERYAGNPILLPGTAAWEDLNVSNAGAAVYKDKVYLLYRAEGRERRSGPKSWPVTRIGMAVSENGYDIACRRPEVILDRDANDPWCELGCEDPRISRIGDMFYIVFVASTRYGWTGDRLALATTRDFQTFQRHGLLMPELEQRTSALLPATVDGRYVLFHRPMPNLWVSFSRDLKQWNGMTCIFQTKIGAWYENKLGIGAPPIETEHGWLVFWHGKNNRREYALGIMLLDKNDPRKILKVQEEPVLSCRTAYETTGFTPNVVYTNGAVRFHGKYFVYYGCCDRCLAVATLDEDVVERWCTS